MPISPSPLLLLLLIAFRHTFAESISIPGCPPSSCGGKTADIYPFWLPPTNSSASCGYPGFDLLCLNGNLIKQTSTNNYMIREINAKASILTLANADLLNSPCPKPLHNLTYDQIYPFHYAPGVVNYTFHFNCSSTLPSYITCLNESTGYSYLVPPEDSYGSMLVEKCEYSIEVPVMADGLESLELEEVLRIGFQLAWDSAGLECGICEKSGGRCGNRTGSVSTFTCLCADGEHRSNCGDAAGGNNSLSKAKKIGIGAGAAMFILVFLFIGILLFKYGWVAVLSSSNFDDKNVEAFLTSNRLLAVKRYKYSEVKRMTTTFREKLGQGGFGTVYKGKLEDGTLVAVKFLKGSKGSSGEEFINEVASIGRTNHVNVVRLLGFCVEGYKRVLIYEFMANGSLEKFLFVDHPTHPIASVVLDWQKLHEIAVGIARGLEYLHKGCNTRMVHFDIKPHNILLDDDFRPKISDFGLAKFCKPKESVLSTICARGTIGYIAPEVFSRNFGVVSGKSDVYSYGMMLLEMAGRRRNVRKTQDIQNTSEIYFPHWIYQHLDECYGLEACVDSAENEIARKMILVGLWCIQTNPSSRPSTTRVVEMLEGSVKDVEIPPKPYICSPPVRSRSNSNIDSLPTFST